MKRLLILSCICLAAVGTRAQDNQDYKMEVGIMLGTGFYNGDLNHSFYGNSGFGGGLIARWHLNPRMAVKGMLSYDAIVKGSTSDAARFFPQNPDNGIVTEEGLNMKINDAVADLSFTFEYNFWPFGLYKGYEERQRLTPFIQLGPGLSYGKAGKAFTPNFCFGFGAKYKLSERWNLGLDWTWHFTLSDKIDNLEYPYGIKSSGFKNKDNYCLTMIFVTYDLFPICRNCNKD